jgi:hypothetical protein
MLADSFSIGNLPFKAALLLSEDTEQLIRELQSLGVLHKQLSCPKCNTRMRMQASTRYTLDGVCWRCTAKACRWTESIRKDSYFHNAHLSLGVCIMIIYAYLKYDKMLQKYISDIVGTSERTVCDWGNFIRETISHYYLENPILLGANNAVQIDESLFGGRRKYNRGDHNIHEKSWVFGMIEEEEQLYCVPCTPANPN